MVNSPLRIAYNVGDVLGEAPDVLAKSMQFFLQGIGLLSGLPMEAGLVGLGRLSRAMSMEDADRPRRSSVLTPPGTASPTVVGSPPKFPS